MAVAQGVQKILLDSTHFNDIRNTISSRHVAWDALVRSAELSEFDAGIAKKLESTLLKHARGGALDLPLEQGVQALVHLLATSNNLDAKRAVLNLLSELFTSDKYVHEVLRYFKKGPELVRKLYESTLTDSAADDQFVLLSCFNVVSLLIQEGLQSEELVEALVSNPNYLRVLTNLERMELAYVCIRLLQELVAVKRYRRLVWKHSAKFVPVIFQIIDWALDGRSSTRVVPTNSNNLGIQAQYYALLTLWLLSFEPQIAADLSHTYLSELLKLFKLVKVTIKEKVTRLSIAILLNCVAAQVKGRKATIKNLLLLGSGLPILQQLSERKYSDDELREDLSQLHGILESEYHELTSLDEYVAELDSKLLVWSPPHTDNTFWSENAHKFKEENWKLFKQLINVLKELSTSHDSSDNVALQVVLNDITHIVELQPECVDILGKLNAKVIIMELLNHPNSKVKYEALKTTQAFVANTFK
ncbi:ACR181Cp [Eremothecium gossypii ATCC 10895]|uniref:V-type proton ATPase subunit H n=1 Tax=Eremothecium gossypii (strain ATCC 10895 / CBS 109.51 / FGSC 9923 / NRRL Y-1056) TaxID=284811 RepID=Q75BU0_EREGS|nr:ACR181Cp [Eremothecium gossypii ATCC 10895]AAS51407.1 ACR181Cp [Eremothecium gossypii ATCC 10895]AEY95698.1 FACR181Cp [Eremothecium gossypii FDAG1]